MNKAFSKIWLIIIILVVIFVVLEIFVWSKSPLRIYQQSCFTNFDCCLRIGPINYLEGYRAGCLKGMCSITTPEGIGPIIK